MSASRVSVARGLRAAVVRGLLTLAMLTFAILTCAPRFAHAADPLDRARIESARDSTLALPEFQYEDAADDDGSLLGAAMRKFLELLQTFRDTYPVLFVVIFCGLLLVLLALIAHIVWTVRIAGRVEFEDEKLALEDALRRADPAPFRERALRLADEGDLENAVQALYVALLLTLDRAGNLHYARHKALLDYQLETASVPAVRSTLDLFSDVYHPGSFGRRPPTRERFDTMVAALDEVAS